MDNVPELRFKEFSDEWENVFLKNLLGFKNGLNASKKDYGFGIKFINVLDILENDYITYDNILDCVNATEDQIKNYDVSYGDILFQRSSETREEVGMPNVYLDKDKNCIFGGFVIRGKKIGDYAPFFLKELLRSTKVRKDISSRSGGSTRYNIGQNALEKVKVDIPSLEEQEKIANFLSKIDEKIAILEDKLQLWETYKKGIMQQLFSQQLRFKDDEGNSYPDWEEKKLEDVCNIKKGVQLNKEDMIENGLYYVLNGGITPSGFTNNWNTSENTITISEGGNSCGHVNYNSEKFWSGGHNYSLDNINEDINLLFLFQELKFQEKLIMRLRVGSGLPNIQKKDLTKFKIEVPKTEEQLKIANFLSEVDEKTKRIANELKINKKFKKGLLQKMFCR